jgi:glycyl-tRNA synthetase beta chain
MPDLLFEIGCEELPADAIPGAVEGLAKLAAERLRQARIAHGELQVLTTPRRLALTVRDVAERQEATKEQVLGPPWNVAFPDGKPAKAAEGFAARQGVPVKKLVKVETEKGAYVGLRRELKAERTARLLPALLTGLIGDIPFPKSMRWGAHDETFGRPVHWLLALFGGKTLRVSFAGIRGGAKTYGHRFLAPKPFKVDSIESYVDGLREARVLVRQDERRSEIVEGVTRAAREKGGRPVADESLIDEVTHLVEWPVPLAGQIDDRFLDIPREVIVTSMRDHQRYFSVEDENGKLLPYFITVSNMVVPDPEVVLAGNRRVLAARLTDAMFFVREDLKKPLADRVDALRGIVFQQKLGTIHEKVERFAALAAEFNRLLGTPCAEEDIVRAATLAKADLTTGMVGEFPELQGVIGAEYATRQGENSVVADAIFDHYLPRGAEEALPRSDVAALIALADKLDTVVGCFGIGLIPSGTADPYALRRAALGIIRILLDKRYALPLSQMVDAALDKLGPKPTSPAAETKEAVMRFVRGRFENLMRTRGIAVDAVEAVLARGFDDLVDAADRLSALSRFRQDPAFESLATAFKRAANLVEKERESGALSAVDASLFAEPAERALHERIEALAAEMRELFSRRAYEEALRVASGLREPVDRFFTDVLVMAPDARVRDNRLALLRQLRDLADSFADFTRLGGMPAARTEGIG